MRKRVNRISTKAIRQAASSTLHVALRGRSWRVGKRKEILAGKGDEFVTQEAAMEEARRLVRGRKGIEVVVHGPTGEILNTEYSFRSRTRGRGIILVPDETGRIRK